MFLMPSERRIRGAASIQPHARTLACAKPVGRFGHWTRHKPPTQRDREATNGRREATGDRGIGGPLTNESVAVRATWNFHVRPGISMQDPEFLCRTWKFVKFQVRTCNFNYGIPFEDVEFVKFPGITRRTPGITRNCCTTTRLSSTCAPFVVWVWCRARLGAW